MKIDEVIAAEISAGTQTSLARDDDRWALTVRRTLRHSPERVWQMITEPDLLALWSPIVPNRPLLEPGPATTREHPEDEPVDAEVLEVDPPRLLVHRWGGHLLRWTVSPAEGGSVLEVRQLFEDRADASSYAAGWRICLGTLAATRDGVVRERVSGSRAVDYGWQELRDQYAAEFAEI
jgi:uncharacterized protein YndB with AHSA1/START domain